jgi:uncharacterized membrane protein
VDRSGSERDLPASARFYVEVIPTAPVDALSGADRLSSASGHARAEIGILVATATIGLIVRIRIIRKIISKYLVELTAIIEEKSQ